jgi:hypothetical protein
MSTKYGYKHDWGPILKMPWADGAECKRCGLIASSAEIARDDYGSSLPECPAKEDHE